MHLLIVEDHALVREGIRMILESGGRFDGFAETSSLEGALRQVTTLGPTLGLVMLDLGLSDATGLTALDRMVDACPNVPIIVVSGETDPDLIDSAFALGARGFVPKNSTGPSLRVAVDSVLEGELYIPPEVLRVNPSTVPPLASAIDTSREHELTARQRDVLRFVALGRSNDEIADELGMTGSTVRVHVSALIRTLGVESRTQAALSTAARELVERSPGSH